MLGGLEEGEFSLFTPAIWRPAIFVCVNTRVNFLVYWVGGGRGGGREGGRLKPGYDSSPKEMSDPPLPQTV